MAEGQHGGQERNSVFAWLLISVAGFHSLYKKCVIEKMLFVFPNMLTQYPMLCGSMYFDLAVRPMCRTFLSGILYYVCLKIK